MPLEIPGNADVGEPPELSAAAKCSLFWVLAVYMSNLQMVDSWEGDSSVLVNCLSTISQQLCKVPPHPQHSVRRIKSISLLSLIEEI